MLFVNDVFKKYLNMSVTSQPNIGHETATKQYNVNKDKLYIKM